MKRKSLLDIAREIAKKEQCNVQKNGDTYSLYSKETNGWRGALSKESQQGIVSNYLIEYDDEKGYFLV